MKTLNLDIWERVQLTTLMAQQRGTPAQYRRFIRVLDVVELSEPERKAIGYEATVTDDGKLSFNWKQQQEYELSFEDADWKTLVDAVFSFDGWPTDRLVGTLLDKIEMVKDDNTNTSPA